MSAGDLTGATVSEKMREIVEKHDDDGRPLAEERVRRRRSRGIACRAGLANLRVAIAHEWLVRYAGSERCVAEMLEAFPGAELLTTVLEASALPASLRRSPAVLSPACAGGNQPPRVVPASDAARLAAASAVRDVDVVISSSHACAKAVRIEQGIPHLCYCHTPMRYAWDFDVERERFPRVVRPFARAGMVWFRRWDRRTARRVTRFVANSSAVARRIEESYGRSACVVHPPVRTDFFTPGGERQDFFLYVGRFVGYKRPDLVIEAFADLPEHRLVMVGEGPLGSALAARATPNVSFVGTLGDAGLRELYRSARAFVYPVDEDFGIAMAEAQSCGTPVIGLSTGGAIDIVEPGRTGWLLREQSVEELHAAIRRAAAEELDSAAIAESAQRFSAARFRREITEAATECATAA